MKPSPLNALLKLLPIFCLTALGPFANAADSPLVIPFQGQVTNQQNQLVATGQYSIIFNLYDVAVGGQPLWTERHSKVGVTNGMVNVFLGSITSLTQVDFSQTRYLGITIDVDDKPTTADPEMVPRQMIIPAFHAKNTDRLAGYNWSAVMTGSDPSTSFIQSSRIDANTINTNQMVNSAITDTKLAANSVTNTKIADGSVTNSKLAANSVGTANLQDGGVTSAKLSPDVMTPPGTVVAYIGDTAPTGWLLCDGSDVLIATYPSLAAVVGTKFGTAAVPATNFKLPDFRGYFLRGVDGGSGRDPDAASRVAMATGGITGDAVGSVQNDQLKSHSHLERFRVGSIQAGSSTAAHYLDDTTHGGVQTGSTGGSETRPRNAYVNYIIKY